MSDRWLPTGYLPSWELHVEHKQLPDAGSFTGGGDGLCWHITVSRWGVVDAMWRVLRDKNAAPHLIIGGRPGVEKAVVVQCIPFDRAARALAHPSGPETNRADKIQVEVCANVGRSTLTEGVVADGMDLFALGIFETLLQAGVSLDDDEDFDLCMLPELHAAFADGVASWSADTYRALASLACLIEHRVPIARRQARSFQNTRRFTGNGWVSAKGHMGHMHCPGNDHIDPTTSFRGDRLIRTMREVDH